MSICYGLSLMRTGHERNENNWLSIAYCFGFKQPSNFQYCTVKKETESLQPRIHTKQSVLRSQEKQARKKIATINNQKILNNYIRQHTPTDIMTSEQQYYSAKVFLKAYNEAHNILKHCAEREEYLNQYEANAKTLVSAISKNEIKLNDGVVSKGSNFNNSRLAQLSKFSGDILSKHFPSLDSASSFQALRNELTKGISGLTKLTGQ